VHDDTSSPSTIIDAATLDGVISNPLPLLCGGYREEQPWSMASLSGFWRSNRPALQEAAARNLRRIKHMPSKTTLERARRAKRTGRAPSTQAGEFVREEIEHVREGKHGARSTKQAIAIGLSKARKAGVDLPPPRKGTTSARTRRAAARARAEGRRGRKKRTSTARSRAVRQALKREPRTTASRAQLSRQAKQAARKRSSTARSNSARRAARTKGAALRRSAAKRAAATRRRRTNA
jgi:hypothetical protein